MNNALRLALIGCGGMGHRHLFGLDELARAGFTPFTLVAACDPDEANARSLADQAQERFGSRPVVAPDLAALGSLAVDAVSICTLPEAHHRVGVEALHRGCHVMVEKPMALTARACNLMQRAAASTGRVLSVAENYRRDPVNRLAKALIEAGVVGQPRLMLHHTLGGGDAMLMSVWRHQRRSGGVLLDVGVHFADIMEYLLGPVTSVYAQTRLHEPVRRNAAAGQVLPGGPTPSGVYAKALSAMPAEFAATAEDAAYATFTFASGAVGSYLEDHASRGEGLWKRAVFGSLGSLDLPGDRSGRRLRLLRDGQEPVDDQRLLERVPDLRLDPATAALFGGERLYEYSFPFAETDRKLLATEYYEFATAIGSGGPAEVDGAQGARAVAVCYAMLESQRAGRPVTVEEVAEDRLNAYQEEVNAELGL